MENILTVSQFTLDNGDKLVTLYLADAPHTTIDVVIW